MTKRLPIRNHRSKGIKVKYVLQIILLLGVCFWLIYQIKHSHDKKKEFDENDANTSVKKQNTDEILKLGRKDPRHGKVGKHVEEEEDETTAEDEGDKHEHEEQEEEEEANKHEMEAREEENNSEVREQGEEENKDEAEDQDEDENKSEEMEGKERGGGDDDIDENDQEIPEADADHDEEFMHMHDDKDREEVDEKETENPKEDKEEGVNEKETENTMDEEKEGLAEEEHTHEAREEHYKADDASSAVAHDDKTTSTETDTLSLENSDSHLDTNPGYTEESNRKQNDSDVKVTEGEMTGHISLSAAATNGEGYVNNSLSDSVAIKSDSLQLEANSTMPVVLTDSNNGSTRTNTDTMVSSEQNKMVTLSAAAETQNATADTAVNREITNFSQDNLPHSNSGVSVKTKNGAAAGGESSNPGASESEKTIRSVASNETEDNSRNSDAKENVDVSKDENSNDKSVRVETDKTMNNAANPDRKEDNGADEDEKFKANTEIVETYKTQSNVGHLDAKENTDAAKVEKSEGDTRTAEVEETSDSSANKTSDEVEHDAIDSSDSRTHTDVTEVQTDLETLPDIRNDRNDGDETAAE